VRIPRRQAGVDERVEDVRVQFDSPSRDKIGRRFALAVGDELEVVAGQEAGREVEVQLIVFRQDGLSDLTHRETFPQVATELGSQLYVAPLEHVRREAGDPRDVEWP
jgi:hypothetical protein